MEVPEVTPTRVAVTVGYLLLGVLGTAVVAMAALNVLQPVQTALYRAVYLRIGPGDATVFAILAHFVIAAVVAWAVVTLVGEYLSDRGENWRPILVAIGAMVGLLLVFLAIWLTGFVGVPLAFLWVLVVGLGVPLLLRFHFGVRSGGIPAFVGGVPVVILLFFLAGFGVGWGWGYVMTAEEIPASSVGDAEVASFDAVPEVRDDLFEGDCSGQTCYLQLRGYEHEQTATRFLADHGVRCAFQGSGNDPGSFVARHDGSYYRVSCSGHGD